MKIIGITGGTGSGKSTALKAIESLGALALDCDLIYHEILANNKEMADEIAAKFINVTTDGKIDRAKLADLVLGNPEALKRLNKITHKYVQDEVEKRISEHEKKGGELVAIDAIALVESGAAERCDVVIGIVAPKNLRIMRIMKRDGISELQAKRRIKAQKSESFYIENSEHQLENNNRTPDDFEKECVEFFTELLKEEQDSSEAVKPSKETKVSDVPKTQKAPRAPKASESSKAPIIPKLPKAQKTP